MPPTFSVYIPTYNRAGLVGQAIKSVLDQTFPDFELIIVDDCSTDGTKEVVSGFSDKRIKYHRNEKNLGCVGAHNVGLKLCTGRYIHPLDSDDILFPANLEKKERIFRENPEVGLIYTDSNLIDDDHNILKNSYWESDGYKPISGKLSAELIACCGLNMINPAYRKEIVDRVGYQNPELEHPHDGDYRLRIVAESSAACIPEVLYSWRMHEGCRHETNNEKMYLERARVIKEISGNYPQAISRTLTNIYVANNHCQAGLFLSKNKEFARARESFKKALREYPLHPLAVLWYLNTYTRIEALWSFKSAKKYFLILLHFWSRIKSKV